MLSGYLNTNHIKKQMILIDEKRFTLVYAVTSTIHMQLENNVRVFKILYMGQITAPQKYCIS